LGLAEAGHLDPMSVTATKYAAFLDRDGVINVDHGYVITPKEFEFLPGVPEALGQLQAAGYLLCIVSNQSGIGRGLYTEADLLALNQYIADCLMDIAGVRVAAFYHCPHHPTEARGAFLRQCECRKPSPGMILQAISEHNIDPGRSILVGDKASDIEAGRAAGVGRLFRVVSEGDVAIGGGGAECVSALSDVPARL
jgi:D-glycero-D-manno-heptose 1,7-bisphosphate phosphatase